MSDSNEKNLFSEKEIDKLPQYIAKDKTDKVLRKIKVKRGFQKPFTSTNQMQELC